MIRYYAALLLSVIASCAIAQPPPTLPPAKATIDSVAADLKFFLGVSNDHYHPGSTAQTLTKAELKEVCDSTIDHMSVA